MCIRDRICPVCERNATPRSVALLLVRPQATRVGGIGPVLSDAVCGAVAANHVTGSQLARAKQTGGSGVSPRFRNGETSRSVSKNDKSSRIYISCTLRPGDDCYGGISSFGERMGRNGLVSNTFHGFFFPQTVQTKFFSFVIDGKKT